MMLACSPVMFPSEKTMDFCCAGVQHLGEPIDLAQGLLEDLTPELLPALFDLGTVHLQQQFEPAEEGQQQDMPW